MAHRTPAQKAATRKMIAANKRRRKGKGKGKSAGKAKSSKRAKHGTTLATLARKVASHETFIQKQRQVNTIFRDALVHVYRETGIEGPSSMRRLAG